MLKELNFSAELTPFMTSKQMLLKILILVIILVSIVLAPRLFQSESKEVVIFILSILGLAMGLIIAKSGMNRK